MKLAIFGGSGATGQLVVQQALRAGHDVAVLLRKPDSLPITHARIRHTLGDLDDMAAVASVVHDADVVISVLGRRKGGSLDVCTEGIRSILAAMQHTGARRLIALSAYGASETRNHSCFMRLVRALISEKMRDKDQMESLVRASGLDWTLLRPAALTNGKAGGHYRCATGLRPGIIGRLPRADLAALIVQLAETGAYLRAAPVISL